MQHFSPSAPKALCVCVCSPREVDRIWGIWGSCCNIPKFKTIFYLLKGDYNLRIVLGGWNATRNFKAVRV